MAKVKQSKDPKVLEANTKIISAAIKDKPAFAGEVMKWVETVNPGKTKGGPLDDATLTETLDRALDGAPELSFFETATLAAVTGGRFELGLGAGHMKSEYDAVGIPFDPGGTRVSRLVESVEVIRALLGGEAVDFDGDHYQVHADTGALVAAPLAPP